ncbi:MAG: hypothetical protein CMF40_02680 [Legionellales bacterium]|nr:hypothetical protein [Legionellales bacterium]|tara:strand:+ start:1274 stop:1621 length:348 start_codon:yes stop_codon:yes gene_type:complete
MRILIIFVFIFINGCSSDEDAQEVDKINSDEINLDEININADHEADEIEFLLKRSIAGTEDLIFLYAENDWRTDELKRQLMEKMDKLMLLYFESGRDMSELEKKLVEIDRQLESL